MLILDIKRYKQHTDTSIEEAIKLLEAGKYKEGCLPQGFGFEPIEYKFSEVE